MLLYFLQIVVILQQFHPLMYTKGEVARLHQKFWTVIGQYMKPVPGANGESVNWINYKTGVRHIFFRINADEKRVSVAIEIRHPNGDDRLNYYNQFSLLKSLLQKTTGYKWEWQAAAPDDNGCTISRISQQLNNVNVLNEADWPAIITFVKPRLVSLDAFWEMVKDGFE